MKIKETIKEERMDQTFTIIFVWIIANFLAVFRFVMFSGMNKKIVIFTLIMINLILGGIYTVYQVGIENVNKSSLIVIAVIVSVVMLFVYYKHHTRK